MPKVASGQPMRSAERLLKVLKLFGDRAVWSVPDIARELDLAPSTVRRLLLTLRQEGFVQQDEAGGRFRLHYEVLRLASAAIGGNSLVQAAAPLLDELRETLDEAAQLTLRDGADLIVVDIRQSRHMVKAFHALGQRYAAYRGSAAGKVHLAWLPEAELLSLLPPEGTWPVFSPKGIGSRDALLAALEATRRRGYGVNDGETELEVWTAAAPVRDRSGRVVAAIAVPVPMKRLTEERRERIVSAVVAAGQKLSSLTRFTD